MFNRFTERARLVVVHAQDEARRLNHNYIGTEHLLLGLLHDEDGVVLQILEGAGVTLARARERVALLAGPGVEPGSGHIPFTSQAKMALELALREALSFDHDYIGPEHVVMGILRVEDSTACTVLEDLGAEPAAIGRVVYTEVFQLPRVDVEALQLEQIGSRPAHPPVLERSQRPTWLLIGWLLFAVAFGLGLLAGWLIWG